MIDFIDIFDVYQHGKTYASACGSAQSLKREGSNCAPGL